MNIDLDASHLAEVKGILHQHVPDASVWAFGSRVTGRAKRFSDLDLALVDAGPLARQSVWELKESFADSDLPFRVDVVDLASVSGEFRAAVEKNHAVLQERIQG